MLPSMRGMPCLAAEARSLSFRLLAGLGDVALKAALDPGIVGLAHGTGGQHGIKQLGFLRYSCLRSRCG